MNFLVSFPPLVLFFSEGTLSTTFVVAIIVAICIFVGPILANYIFRLNTQKLTALKELSNELLRRKEAEKLSAYWTAEKQALLDIAVHGIATLTAEGKIQSINRSASELFGYSIEELVGENISLLLPEVGQIFPGINGGVAFSIKADDAVNRCELNGRKKDGKEIPIEFSTRLIRVENTILCSVGMYDLSERKQGQKKLVESLHEKEILLKEIHHRVKNNLQVISSIFSLQQRKTQDPGALRVLEQSQNRVQSIALLHETLYRSQNLSRIDMGDYLKKLMHHHLRSSKASADIIAQIDVGEVFIHIDKAIPCGLIINELLTNSITHAFSGSAETNKKVLSLSLSQQADGSFKLIFSDTGIGMPSSFDLEKPISTLGLQLVKTLCLQLHGTMSIKSEAGTTFEFLFQP